MSLHVTNMIFNTVLIFCQLHTMAAALPSRFSRKATFLFFNAVGLALLGCCGVLAALFDPDTAISIFGTAYWFPQIAAGLFVAQRRDGQFWCIFFSCDVASVLSSTAGYVIGSWFFPFDTANLGMLSVRSLGVVLGTVFAVRFLIPRFKHLWHAEGVPWAPLPMTVFMLELMILAMTTYPELIFYRRGEHINLLLVCVVSGVVLSMLVISLSRVKAAADHAKELEVQLAMSERYYAELTAQLQENRIRLHDLRHHVNALSGLCSQGDMAGIISYVAGMEQSIPSSSYRPYCVSGAVNALLGHYETTCRERGIDFDCQMCLPVLKVVDPLHLCVIFGNALQNALEAMEKLPQDAPRWLKIRAAWTDGRIAITVSNPFAGTVSFARGSLPASSKRQAGHGFGLLSIQNTVRRYSGWFNAEAQGQTFVLQAVLKDLPTQRPS